MITCWKLTLPLSFVKEKQMCCENSFCVICLKINNLYCEDSFYCLVEEWFYSANIGDVIDDSLLEANSVIVIYLRNGEWTHEL